MENMEKGVKEMNRYISLVMGMTALFLLIPYIAGQGFEPENYLKKENTVVDLLWAYTEYEICNPTETKYLEGMDLTWYGQNEYVKEVKLQVLEEYQENISTPIYDIKEKCKNVIENKTLKEIKHCWNVTYVSGYKYHLEDKTRWVDWDGELNSRISVAKPTCKKVRVYGTLIPKLGERKIDHIPKVFGYEYKKFDWWNISWAYKIPIFVNQTGSTTLTNLPINVTYDTQTLIADGKMNSNCEDIRFLNNTEDGELNFVFENISNSDYGCNTTATQMWVLVDSLPATNTTIYMYYGNATVDYGNTTLSAFAATSGSIWLMGEGVGTRANDATGNNHYMDFVGDPNWAIPANSVFGSAVNFDGTTDTMCAATAPITSVVTNISAGLWINTVTVTKNDRLFLFSKGLVAEVGILISELNPVGRIKGYVYDGALYKAHSPLTYNDGNWHFAVVTYNGSLVKLFIDGNQVASAGVSTTLDFTNYDELCIAGDSSHDTDMLGDFGFLLNRTLSPDEIRRLYQQDLVSFGPEKEGLRITIQSPENKTYYVRDTWFNISVNFEADVCMVNFSYGNNTMSNSTPTLWYFHNSTMRIGTFNAVFYCNDTTGDNVSNSVWFKVASVSIESETYPNETYELDEEIFFIDLASDWGEVDNITSSFIFNGTEEDTVTGYGNTYASTLTMPEVTTDTNISFYWNIVVCYIEDGCENMTTDERNVTIRPIGIYVCTDGNITLEINGINESNFTNTTFSLDLYIKLNNKELNFTLSGNYTYKICINDTSDNFTVNADLEYYGTGFPIRHYFLRDIFLSNDTTYISLYLLPTSESNQIDFIVRDRNYNEQENIVFKALRWFPGLNSYIVVGMGLTGENGKTSIFLKKDVYYKWVLEREGVVLKITSPETLIDDEIIEYIEVSPRAAFFEYYDRIAYSCTVDESGKLIICDYSDTSGKMLTMTLTAKEVLLYNRTDDFCTETSTSNAGTLVCSYAGYENQTILYVLEGYFHGSGYEWPVLVIGYILVESSGFWGGALGVTGILLSFVIIVLFATMGSFRPDVTIFLSTLGIVISFMFGLFIVTPAFIIALVMAAGFLLYKMRS